MPKYTLPDPLIFENGTPVTDATGWMSQRRPEILAIFEHHVYGKAPVPPGDMMFETERVEYDGAYGPAFRKDALVHFSPDDPIPPMRMLIALPEDRTAPVPLFVGINYMPPIKKALPRGYGLALIRESEIDPEDNDGFRKGVHALYPRDDSAGDAWATISAWAWGLSRALDYLETDPEIDATRVAAIGHSRMGKAALWAGATDPRFAMVISNNSGCCGAALSRRRSGETVRDINTNWPNWLCTNFEQYNDNESALPIDQHQLLALIAPRPVYVASAALDSWADPRGEFLAARAADPVYKLLGTEGLTVDEMPEVHSPVHGRIGYHIREGKHDLTDYDWDQYLDFADKHFLKLK